MGRKRTLTSGNDRRKRRKVTVTANETAGHNSTGILESSQIWPKAANPDISQNVEPNNEGLLINKCRKCDALYFTSEANSLKVYTKCCHEGKINLQPLNETPGLLKSLLNGDHEKSIDFHKSIRSYNSALGFASFGGSLKKHNSSGPYAFTLQGQIYHLTSTSACHDAPSYAQLYILDTETASNRRMALASNHGCDKNLLEELDLLIRQNNPYASALKMLHEVQMEENLKAISEGREIPQLTLSFIEKRSDDQRRYNAPRSNEVAIIFENKDGEPPFHRDIKIHYKSSSKTQTVSILDKNLDPMTYPILFPCGDQGWDTSLKLTNGKRMSMLQFYTYRLAIRPMSNTILCAGKLTQQYIVDAYAKIEANRLNFQRHNQSKLRVESYKGLQDFVLQPNQGKAGIPVILPSSFIGSPRCMQQNFQDAMSLITKYGKPDLFITMTCNPSWPEITLNLLPGQTANNRPDLVARVFEMKRKKLLNEIINDEIFGKIEAFVYVIEFQKRGLPHMHALFILNPNARPRTPEDIDRIVKAEIPSNSENETLRNLVLQHMIHGPCGSSNPNSPCMNENRCTKSFPKPFADQTNTNRNGYPEYKRRNQGTVTFKNKTFDNSFVVPYNPYLLQRYCCHINVEICSSVKSVKYLFKYVYKGYDCLSAELRNNDEIENYINARYVSAPEAMHRILEFKMHDISHAIIRLAVHLPESYPVYFVDGEEEQALERNARKKTTLTEWFKLNDSDTSANKFTYAEIPHFYVFTSSKEWIARSRIKKPIISRMFTVSPHEVERFHLRLLLLHVKGAKCWNDLKTVNGILYATFQEAAVQRGLVENDDEWIRCLEEASLLQMPRQLRELFAYICVYCTPQQPINLWQRFLPHLIEDLLLTYAELDCESIAMHHVQQVLLANGKNYSDFSLPLPVEPTVILGHDDGLLSDTDDHIQMLNDHQKRIFDTAISSVFDDTFENRLMYVDGVGGAGKTFLFNTIIKQLRRLNKISCPVASTGIAATLLLNGRTYHSAFGFPVPFLNDSVSRIRHNSAQGRLLKETDLIIWDEVSMAPHYALSALNNLLKDLCGSNALFANKTFILAGDFRQTLPILKHGSKEQVVESCMKFSSLWQYFKHMPLHINMRAQTDPEYSSWILQIGNGLHSPALGKRDLIEIPDHLICSEDLVQHCFTDEDLLNPSACSAAILSPKNEVVDKINLNILKRLNGNSYTYYSADSIVADEMDASMNFPLEFIHGLTPPGTPPHELVLKEGAVVMLLRNLNPKQHLCNGTRLIVRSLQRNVISCEVITGIAKGKFVVLPRIDIIPSDSDLPVTFKRRQFPIKLSWAMTINKSQGQTLDKIGIYLPNPVFSHGQLYVAFSRVKSGSNVVVKIEESEDQGQKDGKYFTKNCVYKEVL